MGAIKRNIPNFITCLNLLSGCMGLIFVVNNVPILASYCMFIGAFFDFIDGLIARALKTSSEIGKQLDSLADIITFGLLPGFIVINMLIGIHQLPFSIILVCLIIPVFSAIRLAIFNTDHEQSYHFKGLATPANGLFWACINICYFKSFETIYSIGSVVMAEVDRHRDFVRNSPTPKEVVSSLAKFINDHSFVLLIAVFVMSFLLIVPIKLMAFKFKGFSWKENQWKYILLIISLPFIILLGFASAPIILILYIIISQIHFRTHKNEI